MLKVAADKLKLEHLVIEKGQFRQERDHPKIVLQVLFSELPFSILFMHSALKLTLNLIFASPLCIGI